MADGTRVSPLSWTTLFPLLTALALPLAWGRDLPPVAVALVIALLGGSVLAAVHHAEVVAHRVGEPYGSLVLAVAVTVIEVALIVDAHVRRRGRRVHARSRHGVCRRHHHLQRHRRRVAAGRHAAPAHRAVQRRGRGAALATITTLATLGLVLPTFTTATPGPEFSPAQLAFAATVSLALYGLFVFVQTGRHRDYFLPTTDDGAPLADDAHAAPPSARVAMISMSLLLVALVAVVGTAKLVSPTVERAVVSAGMPLSVVGVVIALLILLPETVAAMRAARRGRLQISLNLAYGSAMASIGLTIPTMALVSPWLPVPLHLGLGSMHLVLLALTTVVSVLTVVPGRATLLQAGVHLSLLAAYLFLSVMP